jgi:hypothetical protein
MFHFHSLGSAMSQLFTAVYEVTSAVEGNPTLRLSLVVNALNDSVMGHARVAFADGESAGISVRGHHTQIEGGHPLQAVVLAGLPAIFPSVDEEPSAFQLLMVLPTALKDGQVCYKMSFGDARQPRIVEVRDGTARAVLPEFAAAM